MGHGRPADIPPEVLRRWEQAEARLFPLIMSHPGEYERAVRAVQRVRDMLRVTCPDVPALLAVGRAPAGPGPDPGSPGHGAGSPGHAVGDPGHAAGHPGLAEAPAGLPADVVLAAACASRYRELVAEQAARSRRDRFAEAVRAAAGEPGAGRAPGGRRAPSGPAAWATVEQSGDRESLPYRPYQRVEAHLPSGRAVVVSAVPDETLSRVAWHLDEAALDPADGSLAVGRRIGSYPTAAACEASLALAKARLGGA